MTRLSYLWMLRDTQESLYSLICARAHVCKSPTDLTVSVCLCCCQLSLPSDIIVTKFPLRFLFRAQLKPAAQYLSRQSTFILLTDTLHTCVSIQPLPLKCLFPIASKGPPDHVLFDSGGGVKCWWDLNYINETKNGKIHQGQFSLMVRQLDLGENSFDIMFNVMYV